MRFLKRNNEKYTNLPDQEELFALPYALFGQVDKRSLTVFGWRWRKRVVVLSSTGHLIIYKNYESGIGASEPLLGRIIHMDTAVCVRANLFNNICHIKINDQKQRRTELRVYGTKARLWAAKIFMYEAELTTCEKRSTCQEINWPQETRPLNLLDSKISTSSVHDLQNRLTQSGKTSKITNRQSGSFETLPDYTTSDASCQNCKFDRQIIGPEKIQFLEKTEKCVSKPSHQSDLPNVLFRKNWNVNQAKLNTSLDTMDLMSDQICCPIKHTLSAVDFTTTEYSTAKEPTRSISLDHIDTTLAKRRERFRKHLRGLLASRLYDSLTECSIIADSMANVRAQAGNIRLAQVYCPNFPHDDGQKETLRAGPSLPLSIDVNNKSSVISQTLSVSDVELIYRL